MIKKDKLIEGEDVRLRYEIDIIKNLHHPNIMTLYEVYEDQDFIYLVTELCHGRDLFDEIYERGKLSEKDAADILK